jgi:hypothetical protein
MLKLTTLSMLLAVAALAQTTVPVGNITIPDDVALSVEQWRADQWINLPAPMTITADATNVATSITLSNTAGGLVAIGKQIRVDNEVMMVTNLSGNVATVTRARALTTAAAHSSGANVNVLRHATAVALCREFIKRGVIEILRQKPSPTLQTFLNTLTTTQSSADAYIDGAVQ